jgi:serine/threonine protein kinase
VLFLIKTLMEEREGFVFKDYTLIKRLDSGNSAHVWLALHNPTEIKVALKIVEKSKISGSKQFMKFMCGITLMRHVKHPFVTRLFEVVEIRDCYVIVIQYCENGTLEDLILRKKQIPEDSAKIIFSQIALALDFLHNDVHVAHRDIKPQNILLDKNNYVHLADFGLSKSFTEAEPLFSTFCGTPQYIAPEILNKPQYSAKADIWSLGVILYLMVYGHLPFEGQSIQEITQKISYSDPIYAPSTSSELRDLMQKLLNKNPNERPSMSEILKHPWLNNNNLIQKIRNNIETYFKIESDRPKFVDIGEKIEFIEKEKERFNIESTYCSNVVDFQCSCPIPQKEMKTSKSTLFTPKVFRRIKNTTPINFPRKKSSI